MDRIQEHFSHKIPTAKKEIKDFLSKFGNEVVGDIKVTQLYQGMRGMPTLICETSKLDPEEGIRFRGYSIPELQKLLPKYPGGEEPLPEGLFYLILMNELPTEDDVRRVSNNWARRAIVPPHVFKTIDALPFKAHPMTQFVVAIMALRTESIFAREYASGCPKSEYWIHTFEDSMNLISRLPRIAAYIYRRAYKNDQHIEPDTKLDWAGNFAHMLGFDNKEFLELMRLYMTIHSDHEGGNVSAHTVHLVGSALSDAYQSFAAGMNGLAGPLHGLANQE
jgi:citrate synthase